MNAIPNGITSIGYTGAYRDPITLAYPLGNGYRFYMPNLMRFNAADDWSPFSRGGINPYAYCAADPINRRDWSGHAPDIEELASELASDILGTETKEASQALAAKEALLASGQKVDEVIKRPPSPTQAANSLTSLHEGTPPVASHDWIRSEFLYRGVAVDNPFFEEARQGIAVPKGYNEPTGVNEAMTAATHNASEGYSDESPFTSWSRSRLVATSFAEAGGVVLKLPTHPPGPEDLWSWHESPDEFGELEVLLRGRRSGAEVTEVPLDYRATCVYHFSLDDYYE